MLSNTAKNQQDNDESGSAGMMALAIIGILMLLFIFILMGGVFDKIVEVHENVSQFEGLPVSDERVGALNFLTTAMIVYPFLGILIPMTMYALIIGVRGRGQD